MKKKVFLTVIIIILLITGLTVYKVNDYYKKKDYITFRELSEDFKFLASDYKNIHTYVNSFSFHLKHNYYIYIDLFENNKKIGSNKYLIKDKGIFYQRVNLDKSKNKAHFYMKDTSSKSGYITSGDLPFKNINRASSIEYTINGDYNDKIVLKDNKKRYLGDISFCISPKNEDKLQCEYKDVIEIHIQRTNNKY